MNHIIRNLHIDLIMGNTNPFIDEFNELWDKLSVCEINVYHNNGGEFIYYDKDNKWVFYIDNGDDNDDGLYCSKTRYWDVLMSNTEYGYSTFKTITKIMLEYKLNTIMRSELDSAVDNSIQKLVKVFNNYIQQIN